MKPISQKWLNENRERYGAETSVAEPIRKCRHKLFRVNANEVQCKLCHVGWRFDIIPQDLLDNQKLI